MIESVYSIGECLKNADLERLRQAFEEWAQIYPRDEEPRSTLSDIYYAIGQYEKALSNSREVVVKQRDLESYFSLASIYLRLNRLEEARTALKEVQKRRPDSGALHYYLYELAFLENDAAGMAQQVAWSAGKKWESELLATSADTAAYFGQLEKYRDLSRQAVAAAVSWPSRRTYTRTLCGMEPALAALFGYSDQARRCAEKAFDDEEARYGSGMSIDFPLAMSIAGATTRPNANADSLVKATYGDALLHLVWLPTLRAQVSLNRKDPARALEVLKTVAPYELGGSWDDFFEGPTNERLLLFPVYLRASANLAAPHLMEAAADFQEILDHRGIVFNEPIGALAHLGLARAYALQGDSAKAKVAYNDFLTLWKDADPDVPILKQAKAEYAKLQ